MMIQPCDAPPHDQGGVSELWFNLMGSKRDS
jgi:hypothetical protein